MADSKIGAANPASGCMVSLKPLAASLVFLPLAGAAVWAIYGQLYAAGVSSVIMAPLACPYPPKYTSQSQLKLTGIHIVDQAVCLGVELTTVGLFRHNQPFTVHFLANLSSFFLAINIEGSREDGPSRLFAFFFTFLSMACGAGIAIPLAWLYFFVSSSRYAERPLTRQAAEGVLLSHMLGYLLPTALMISSTDPTLIALWGLNPVITTLVKSFWSSIRPPTSESGLFSARVALFTALMVSSFIHLGILFRYAPMINSTSIAEWLPSWSMRKPDRVFPVEGIVLQYLQWDAIFTYISGITAGFFFVDSWPELLLYVMAIPMVLTALGPGAVLAGMWAWREWKLNILADDKRQRLLDKQEKST